MRKEREALLIAALAGLVIVGAAAFVVQPELADKSAPAAIHISEAGSFGLVSTAPTKSA
jgi:hypothetical protein